MSQKNHLPFIINVGLYDLKLNYGCVSVSPVRTTNFLEIELPLEDGGTSYINNVAYPIERDRLICAKPGQKRKSKPPFRCLYIHIDLPDDDLYKPLFSIPDTIKLANRDTFSALFNEIIREYNKRSDNAAIMVYSKVLALISETLNLSAIAALPHPTKSHTTAIEEAIHYIEKNYMNKITLEMLSNITHLSPFYLHKVFYNTVGMTPYDYILNKRIKKAKQLLTFTNLSLTTIANSCGFTDQSYFGKVFKQELGITPLKFRKNKNKQYHTEKID